MIGSIISHYKILEKLGEGGMGVVYKAEDTKLHRTVALKFLPQDKLASRADSVRFAREARAAASLNHPNIATIFEFDEVEDTSSHTTEAFIAMEYVEGTTLQEIIKRGPLPLDLITSIALQLATALQTAHKKNIVHRDLKPGNVIMTPDGVAKILDFGVSKLVTGEITTTVGKVAGSPAYMSPEQAQGGHVDQRSDLFSLGVVLYEMVSGRRPFTGEHDAQVLYLIINIEPESPSRFRKDLPPGLERLILRLLEKEPSRRYQTAAELIADLQGFPQPGKSVQRLRLSSLLRRTWRQAMVGLLVIVALVYVATLLDNRHKPDTLPDVAVLPFVNVDQDRSGQAFCDGLVEILTSKLTELQRFQRSISVVPATEIRNRKITTPSDAYKTLGASLVITGSYQRVTEGVRLTLTIIDAIEIRQLRSVVVDDPLTNVATFQDGIVMRLASMLDVELRPQTLRHLASDSTTNPRAYTLFLEAKGFMQRGLKTRQLDTAITLFTKALEEDPRYTDAYAGLASAYEALGQNEKAESVQQQAVKIRPDSWRAYNDLGLFYSRRARFEDAARAFQRVTELSPDNIRGYNNLGGTLLYLERDDEARQMFERSLAIIPNHIALSNLGSLLFYYEKSYAEAASIYEQALLINDRDYRVWGSLASAQYWGNQRPKALENYITAVRLGEEKRMFEPQNAKLLSYLADFYSMMQQKDTSLSLIEHALAIPPPNSEIMARAAEVYDQLGIRDKALEWIERAQANGYPTAIVERSPGLAELRKDKRFKSSPQK